ncbi:hypothetical protein MBLNU13_g05251t2 [Cladosporium sp. NU13]
MVASLKLKNQPDELPPGAKLQAGYVRYVRIRPEQGPDGEVGLETCIRRSRFSRGYYEHPGSNQFHYTAISYAWGDALPRHPVIVDGHKRRIATNLWWFLQRANMQRTTLRDTKEERDKEIESKRRLLASQHSSVDFLHAQSSRRSIEELRRRGWSENWLWIDALCIDQSDARERTHQVGIMSEIFERADQVISWLGPAYDNSEHAMSIISAYSDEFPVEHQIISPTELSEAICSLCERAYWKRLWVFQELRHARLIVLMCGDQSLSWDDFGNLWRVVVDIATTSEDASERLRQSLATRMITLRTKPLDFSLWNLLQETRSLECADQRDRVYALLSVASEGHEHIKADYGNSVTPLNIAHDALLNKYAIRTPRALDDVLEDCRFLEAVFGMPEDVMLRYDRRASGDPLALSWISRWPSDFPLVDAQKPRVDRAAWSAWAQYHGYAAVTGLLEDVCK